MALQSFEKRRPTYTTTPQDPRFRVEPGTLKFDVGGGAQDYAETRPVVSDPGRIPQSLRDSAFGAHSLRPLMQGNSDGSPLSLADMESNTRAMDALDEHFSLRPSAKALELMQLEAETAKQEKLADDPLFFEREKDLMSFNRRRFEMAEKARLEGVAESDRRDAFAGDLRQLETDAQAEIQAALAEGDTAGAKAIEEMLDKQRQLIREKHGIGAKIGAAGLYKQDGL